jgi:hypothetical protein
MPSNFTPFPAASSASPATRPPQPTFAPVVPTAPQGTNIPPISNPAATQGKAKACAPVVDVEREGERITRIRIKCSCGELIEIDCQY